MMKDVFDATILCKACRIEMTPLALVKSGFRMRAVECPRCKDKIIHPADVNNYNYYNHLRGKTYSVKLRLVGNSHAVSIPKEIVDFINEMNQRMRTDMNDVVRMCFDDFGKLSLNFFDEASFISKQNKSNKSMGDIK